MGLILDSSILIAAERGRLRFEAFCAAWAEEELFLAAITASELLHGVERALSDAIRLKRAAWVERLLGHFEVLDFDLDVAREHARLWAKLAAKGEPIGPHDLQIAATALRHGFLLATLNRAEFQRAPGLVLADVQPYLMDDQAGGPR